MKKLLVLLVLLLSFSNVYARCRTVYHSDGSTTIECINGYFPETDIRGLDINPPAPTNCDRFETENDRKLCRKEFGDTWDGRAKPIILLSDRQNKR